MAVAPSRTTQYTDLTPHLGGSIYSAIPAKIRKLLNSYIVLSASPGDINLKLWSEADNPAAPGRTLIDWTASIATVHDPAVLRD